MAAGWFSNIKLRLQTSKLAADLNNQIETMRRLSHIAQNSDDKALLSIANFNLCILLFRRDFQFLFNDTLLERNMTKKNLLARQLAVSLFDFLERIHSLIGTGIRPEIQKSSLPQTIREEMAALGREIGQLREKHGSYLSELRNVAGAHRDLDGLLQLHWIEATDIDKILSIAQQVSEVHATLMAAWIVATQSYLERTLSSSNYPLPPGTDTVR